MSFSLIIFSLGVLSNKLRFPIVSLDAVDESELDVVVTTTEFTQNHEDEQLELNTQVCTPDDVKMEVSYGNFIIIRGTIESSSRLFIISYMRGKPNDHNNYFSNAIDVDALPTGSAGSAHARLVLLMLRSQ